LLILNPVCWLRPQTTAAPNPTAANQQPEVIRSSTRSFSEALLRRTPKASPPVFKKEDSLSSTRQAAKIGFLFLRNAGPLRAASGAALQRFH